MIITNDTKIPLATAVMLMYDDYDHQDIENYISATSIMKSIKSIILSARVDNSLQAMDIASKASSTVGTAVHNHAEKAWQSDKLKGILRRLDVPEETIARIRVNPSESDLKLFPDTIPVYQEQRAYKKLGKYTIGGKFDLVMDGRVEDFKTTKTWAYNDTDKDEDYILQGSIYRWLSPDKITKDEMGINFIFTDFAAGRVGTANYPDSPAPQKRLPLKSIEETELYLQNKIDLIDRLADAPEEEIPECTPKELWQKPDVYKYYSNPEKLARATKNFDNYLEAMNYRATKGVGIVTTVPGKVAACNYCPAFAVCKQKDTYIEQGLL